jgi:hypothetical protein
MYTLTALLTFLRSLLPVFQGVRPGSPLKDGDIKGLQSISSTVRFCTVLLSINRTNISIKHVHNLTRRLIGCMIKGHLISSMFRNVCYLSTGKTLNKTGSVHVMYHWARSCKRCCHGKALIITYFECVSVALVIQHAKHMHHIICIIIYGLSSCTIFFCIVSWMAQFLAKSYGT